MPFLRHYNDELIADAGGDDISSGKKHTVEIAQTARGCSMLVLKELKEKGFVITTTDGWDMHPGLKELARFLDLELRALRLLGLERRAKDVLDVNAIKARYEGVEDDANGNGADGADGQ